MEDWQTCMYEGTIWEDQWKKCKNEASVSALAIDETLYPHCGHIALKWYNPNYPAKYDLCLCDSSIRYTCYSWLYAGNSEKVEGPSAKYCFTRTDKYSKCLINIFSVYCKHKEIHISMDHYFISVCQNGLQRKISPA